MLSVTLTCVVELRDFIASEVRIVPRVVFLLTESIKSCFNED